MSTPRFFEDYFVGETFTTGWAEVSYDDAVRFARAYDPQDFHTNDAAAALHPVFRGLSASGFFTLVLIHQLILEEKRGHAWGLIGKGIDDLRWLLPVRPGDHLRVNGTVVRLSRDPQKVHGTVGVELVAENQDGQPVLTMVVETIVPSRETAPLAAEAA